MSHVGYIFWTVCFKDSKLGSVPPCTINQSSPIMDWVGWAKETLNMRSTSRLCNSRMNAEISSTMTYSDAQRAPLNIFWCTACTTEHILMRSVHHWRYTDAQRAPLNVFWCTGCTLWRNATCHLVALTIIQATSAPNCIIHQSISYIVLVRVIANRV